MSWEVLGRDPVPGDVDAVKRVADVLGQLGEHADAIGRRLRVVGEHTGTGVWRGEAAEAFRFRLAEIEPEVARFADSHHSARDALQDYAVTLAGAQDDARQAEAKGEGAVADRTVARRKRDAGATEEATQAAAARAYRVRVLEARATEVTATAIGDQAWHARLVAYEHEMGTAQGHAESSAAQARGLKDAAARAESQAQARLTAAQALGQQAKELRDTAGHTVVSRLDAAGRPALGLRNPVQALFGGVVDALRHAVVGPTFMAWLNAIDDMSTTLTIIGLACLVIGVVFPPALVAAVILFAVVRGLTLIHLVGTFFAAVSGQMPWSDALKGMGWDVVGLLPGPKEAKAIGNVIGKVHQELGVVKRTYYLFHKHPMELQKIKIAPAVKGFEKVVVDKLHLDPRLYYVFREGLHILDRLHTVHDIGNKVLEWTPPIIRPILVHPEQLAAAR